MRWRPGHQGVLIAMAVVGRGRGTSRKLEEEGSKVELAMNSVAGSMDEGGRVVVEERLPTK